MGALALLAQVKRFQKMKADAMTRAAMIRAKSLAANPTAIVSEAPKTDPARWANDFEGFYPLLDIIPKDGRQQKLRLNAIQSVFNVSRTGRDIVLKARQVGLTTLELARDVWFFLTRPGARVFVVCQSSTDHSALNELSEKIRLMFESLKDEGINIQFRSESVSTWKLAGKGSILRIIEAGASEKAASKKGRAGTIHRLHITELAFFEYAKTTLNAILECVPPVEDGSEIVIESTANGAVGIFYEKYTAAMKGRGDLHAHFFTWFEQDEYRLALEPGEVCVPLEGEVAPELRSDRARREHDLVDRFHISPEQLKWYRAKVEDKGQDLVDQEYPSDEATCWLVWGRVFFDRDITKALLTKTSKPIAIEQGGALKIWKRAQPGRRYVIGADPSEGMGGDPGAGVVRDAHDGEHMATLHGQFTTWNMGAVLAEIGLQYNEALIVVERNNHGGAVLNSLEQGDEKVDRKPYRNIYTAEDEKLGWNNTEVRRKSSLAELEGAHRSGEWKTHDAETIKEMLTFIVNKKGKAEGAPGANDDLMMAENVCWDALTRSTAPIAAQPRAPVSRWENPSSRGF